MNNTKRSFLTSVVSLVLCFTMFLGTTFAWFTDVVSSNGNVIESGKLDAEMYWSDKLLAADSTEWNNAEEGEPVFNYNNWEPGYTQLRYVMVKNAGSLNLKYKLSIEAEGRVTKLADVIDVYYVNPVTTELTKDALKSLTPAGTLSDVLDNKTNTEGRLTPAGTAILAIAFHMDEQAGNDYQGTKLCNNGFSLKLLATQDIGESDSFGDDYDKDAQWPEGIVIGNTASADVTTNANNETENAVTMTSADGKISASVPAGTLLSGSLNKLTLSVANMDKSNANITLDENEASLSIDVHILGVDENNTTVMAISVKELLPVGLNMGNYRFYHVEDGNTVEMTLLQGGATPVHNNYEYDPATGDVVLHLASFSEVALVADTENAWEGTFDYTWYDASKTELTIANADQLAAFSAIVGGMKKVTGRENNKYTYSEEIIQNSFSGKTVKLLADINLGDKESENNPDIIFYPIGYYNSEGTYERTNTAITSGLRIFEGTFDGNGHTVANFYQNTWEMKGDNNYYDATLQYYRDGMGLFGKVYGGTIKNLTVKNFSSDGEYTTTGTIAAYADGATFENIAIFNCNPRVYNIGNGGIVGCVGWYAKEAGLTTTFTNITVDNSNKISALWGSYDVACGGIVGQYYPTSGQTSANKPENGGISFENCHVSAVMDVYNDVCANYQYYAYRYTGMLIGSVRENVTIDGHSYPKMDGITAENCTVHFGTWNDYYYCEIIDNTTASYTHDYQMSRLTEIKAIDGTTITYLDGTTGTVPASGRANYVIVDYTKGHGTENATCYHFKDGKVWNHEDGGKETINGVEVLKEDKQHIYLEFNNLVTGYGWGVTSKWVGELAGVTILDRAEGNSVVKFESNITNLANNKTYKLGDIFTFVDKGVELKPKALNVSITNLDENNPVSATIVYDRDNWENGTITFTGAGKIQITIQDYYFCTPTTIEVTITDRQPEVKFETKFTGDFLYRVGNQNAVALGSLFKAKDGAKIGTVSVTVETITGASGTYTSNATWTNGTIQFNGTGVVKVTITDNDYCTPTVLYLEVVDATNVTGLSGTISGNVVLLNDCGLSSLTVSGRNTVFGNGFTATYSGNGQYKDNGLDKGVVTVNGNGMVDNLRIIAPVYPYAYLYYSDSKMGEAVKDGPYSQEGDRIRYHYQLSAITMSGNATISNCYVYGGRNNIFVNTGDVTIKDTILECGTVANMQIESKSDYTVTLENVTTIQHQVTGTGKDKSGNNISNTMFGAGIIVGPTAGSNPKLILNGHFKQYNWVTSDDKEAVSSDATKAIIGAALDKTEFNHTIDGKTASNLGIVYMNTYAADVTNNTGLPYVFDTVTMTANVGFSASVNGQVCSLQKATADQIYSDYANADRTTVNGLYQPQFKYDDDLGGQEVPETEDCDEFLYRDGNTDTIKVMFVSGDTKTIDLATLVNILKYAGQNLELVVTVKDGHGNNVDITNGKITLSAADEYTVTYTVTDTLFYDKDGESVSGTKTYSWNITISVSLKDKSIPDAYFKFDPSKQIMGYGTKSGLSGIGKNNFQYLPFLAGLQIYDYNGQTEYLRFDGNADFNKIASVSSTFSDSTLKATVVVKLVDGGTITAVFGGIADSGSKTKTGSIQVTNNTLYWVTDGDTAATSTTWTINSYTFVGNNGVEIKDTTQVFAPGSKGTIPSGSFNTKINSTVTYDANGGNCGQTTGYATSAAAAVTLPTPSRSGYIFAGWYTAASGGTRVGGAGEPYTPSANITLYAQWGKPCTVTYNANGGSCGTTSAHYDGTALTLPEASRDGYWFVGWYDAAEGGNKIGDAGATYNPSGETTLYAHWQEKVEYTVTYNANGGSCGTASATYKGAALTLPTPTRTGYTFNGWYTAASGGTKIEDPYTPSANITLYAQWEALPTYTITIGTQSNATVTVDKNSTYEGDTVTVTVSFSQSNNRSLTVKDASGNTVLSKSAAGTYTFTMPASNVTIEASSSSSCFTPDTLITLADGSQKRVDELQLTDKILAWDFFTGTYVEQDVAFLVNHGEDLYRIANLSFSDGTELRVIGEHGIFDYDFNKFVYLSVDNMSEYIGHRFVKYAADGSYDIVTLTSAYETEEYTTAWSITSTYTSNAFASGLLTVGPPDDFYNWIEMDGKLHYDVEQFQKDVETYGLYTYDDFKDYLTYEQFVTWNGAYLKIAVEKGYFTFEYILELIDMYGAWMI